MSAGPVGILVALTSEASCVGGSSPRGIIEVLGGGTLLLVGGVGTRAAEEGARSLLARGARALVSFGVAGGLDEEVRAGELILPEHVIDIAGEEHAVDAAWRNALARRVGAAHDAMAWHGGRLLESERVVADPGAKRALCTAHIALAVDMESGTLGRIAREAAVPWIVVRAISDDCTRPLPPAALCVDRDGRLQKRRFLRALLRDPWQLPTLFALRSDFHAAQRTLRTVWSVAGPDLAFR